MEEFIFFYLLLMALYKNSIISLVYCYFAMLLIFQKYTNLSIIKVLSFVSICVIIQYFICLTNLTMDYPIPYNQMHTPKIDNPDLIPWNKYVTMSKDWRIYFLVDNVQNLLYSLKHETFLLIIGSLYVFVFSPYVFNCNETEMHKAIDLPDDPSIVYMVNECEN